MAVVDKKGQLVRFSVIPGNAAENRELPTLLNGVPTSEVIADKAFDTDAIRQNLASSQRIATIPPKSNRRVPPWYDRDHYQTRHLVENWFADVKQFRGIATRYSKLVESYKAFISIVAWYLGTKAGGRIEKTPVYKKSKRSTEGQMQLAQATVGNGALW